MIDALRRVTAQRTAPNPTYGYLSGFRKAKNMSKQYDVCILGATGAVGEAMLAILEQRKFPVRNLYPLASSRSAGSTVQFKGKELEVIDVEGFDFSKAQIGLFSACGRASGKKTPLPPPS